MLSNVSEKKLAALQKKASLTNTIYNSSFIYKQFNVLNLCKFYSDKIISRLMNILISIFISCYHSKNIDFARNRACHQNTIAHFLNNCKQDDSMLSDTLKKSVIEIVYLFMQKRHAPNNLFSILLMIRLLQRQRLHHRLCIPLKC